MHKPRYTIKLTKNEITRLEKITSRPSITNAKVYMYARALLLCDTSEEKKERWTVEDIADVLGVTSRTIEHLKQRMCEDGLDAALGLEKKNIKPRNIKFDGEVQAKVIATACMKAPEGHVRWTVRLLADRLVELGVVDSISPMSVHRILKKTNFNLIGPHIGRYRRR